MRSQHAAYRPTRVELLGLFAVVILLVAGYWWTHPKVFAYGSEIGAELAPGDTIVFGVLDQQGGDDETVHVLGIEPRTMRDETAARYEFLTCVLKDPRSGIGATDEADVPRICASTTPATGKSFALQDGRRSQTLMNVTVTKPGRLEIDGVDVTYQRSGAGLFQTGTQQAGMAFRLTVR